MNKQMITRGGYAYCYCIGNGQGDQNTLYDVCKCLNCMHDPMTIMVKRDKFKTYGISSYDSNAMKSKNPESGIYKTDSTRTLDVNGGNPACNQGGVLICQATFEGNGCRPSHQGLGLTIGTNEMYTLNSTEVHGVITERRKMNLVKKDGTVTQTDEEYEAERIRYDEEHANDSDDVEYDVRRLTPIECARLQGFPPDYCADVPHSDSAEYKLWGNGIALPSILPMMQNAVRYVENLKAGNKDDIVF